MSDNYRTVSESCDSRQIRRQPYLPSRQPLFVRLSLRFVMARMLKSFAADARIWEFPSLRRLAVKLACARLRRRLRWISSCRPQSEPLEFPLLTAPLPPEK